MTAITERPKLQFQMRDLLRAMGLMGVAMGYGVISWQLLQGLETEARMPSFKVMNEPEGRQGVGLLPPALFVACIGAGACLGAGLGCMLQRPKLGAIWGAIFGISLGFGFACWRLVSSSPAMIPVSSAEAFLMGLAAAISVGAGIGSLFRKPARGAAFGGLAALALGLLVIGLS